MTLWHPDTCQCEITIEDDQTSPNWSQPIRHEKVCSVHATLGVDHLGVLAENQRKNLALADLHTTFPNVKSVSWGFDASRTVILTINPADPAAPNGGAKQAFQTQLNTKYGAGKVKVV